MSDDPLAAASTTRRSFLIGSAMTLTAGGAYAAAPRHAEHRLAKVKLADLISTHIGGWRFATPDGVIVPREDGGPSDGYDQVLTRVYEAAGLPAIMLLLAYGSTQGGSLQLHRPETCYPGQGFLLSAFSENDFDFGDQRPVRARRFTARRDDRIERLVYWTRISRDFPRNTAEEYAAIFRGVLTGVIPDGILVRVSTIGSDIAQSDIALNSFIRSLVASAVPAARQILIGDVISAEIAGKGAAHG